MQLTEHKACSLNIESSIMHTFILGLMHKEIKKEEMPPLVAIGLFPYMTNLLLPQDTLSHLNLKTAPRKV